jgi:3-isopropylmalate dehydrogenase
LEFRIAVLPGDGVGPDVVAEALRVLNAVERRLAGARFHFSEHAAGAAEYLRGGDPLPAATMDACARADAILLGAMGLPSVRWPSGAEMTPQIDLRELLDLYAGVRPCRLYHGNDTPLKGRRAGDIDLVVVRESTEGLFSGRKAVHDPAADEVCDPLRVSRRGAERICRAAFELALKRRRRVALIDKANVLPSMVFFRSIFHEVAALYPGVETEALYVDATALYLVQRPERFDILVTENMFGDILSDLTAGIVGGMGMAPSADIGEKHAVFQPSHGSAPDIAGRGIANPVATILSAAMMLEWLPGEDTVRGAQMIRRAVERVLSDPANRTPDLGGQLTTAAMGELIAGAVAAAAE